MPKQRAIFQAVAITAFFILATIASGVLASGQEIPGGQIVVSILQLHDE